MLLKFEHRYILSKDIQHVVFILKTWSEKGEKGKNESFYVIAAILIKLKRR